MDSLVPGASTEWRIELENDTPEPLPVAVFPVAATIDEEGFNIPSARVESVLTSWITVQPDQLEIAPRERREVTITLSVPGDARGGEHYAAVVAEPPPIGEGDVQLVNRVAVRVYLAVEGDAAPVSDFEIDDLRARRSSAGTPVVDVTVTNIGERALDLSGELALDAGPAGLSAGPFPATTTRVLAPGDSGVVSFQLDPQLPAGPWQVFARLVSGNLERAAEATITFPEAAGESAAPVDATEVPLHQDRGVLIPFAIGLTLLTLLLLLLFWRRRKRDDEEEAPRPVDVGAG